METLRLEDYRAKLSYIRTAFAHDMEGSAYRRLTSALVSSDLDFVTKVFNEAYPSLNDRMKERLENVKCISTAQKAPEFMDAKIFKKTARSRQDVYNILTIEGGYYLPPFSCCSMKFLGDVLSGAKLVFRKSQMHFCKVPHYAEFDMNLYIEDRKEDPLLQIYLPDLSDKMQMDRAFFFNIFNTVHEDKISKVVKETLKQRSATLRELVQPIPLTKEMNVLFTESSYLPKGNVHHAGAGNLTTKYQTTRKKERKKEMDIKEITDLKAKKKTKRKEEKESPASGRGKKRSSSEKKSKVRKREESKKETGRGKRPKLSKP